MPDDAGTRPADHRTEARRRGDAAEEAALQLLRAAGLVLLARNLRFKVGELDLVMREGSTLVIVEVRRRQHAGWGDALASIDRGKARRLVRATEALLQRQPRWASGACRFDVVAFDAELTPHWLRGAFTLDAIGLA
ncbi:YraN family protein [Silanimonas sp.]|uniref:YraN family protein n=1 Tax=Silanimonas sp. TaxID=1929290 RepID=UPI001BBF76A6|nr:YraN family protein [Silanimonas sp.]MBS3896158.1 YraN family protein [Silanimonas sp.]MBS3924904.1 YraN family protein [Xanthomonadaceae bacterium]